MALMSGKQLLAEQKDLNVMTKFINRFAKDESGATAIEYGLIAALIAVVLITTMKLVGSNLSAKFQEVADELA
jgi:pilus assembly protein Flp/PilA